MTRPTALRAASALLVGMFSLAATWPSAAQGAYAAGQAVEAKSYFYNPPWHSARILSVGTDCPYPTSPYRVRFTGPDAGDHGDPCVGEDQLRPLEPAAPAPPAGAPGGPAGGPPPDVPGPAPAAAAAHGPWQVGDRVDIIESFAKDKGSRGTIIEAAGGRYKVHRDGCGAHFDAFYERDALHPAATISSGAAEIRFLVGKWAMFTPSYPNTIVSGNTILREYGMGAKAPPLQINADGTYVWYFDYGAAPVRGRWTTHAKIEGTRYGTEVWDGVIIKAPDGHEWKVHRWRYAGDNIDRITAQTMCSGQTVNGTRV